MNFWTGGTTDSCIYTGWRIDSLEVIRSWFEVLNQCDKKCVIQILWFPILWQTYSGWNQWMNVVSSGSEPNQSARERERMKKKESGKEREKERMNEKEREWEGKNEWMKKEREWERTAKTPAIRPAFQCTRTGTRKLYIELDTFNLCSEWEGTARERERRRRSAGVSKWNQK